MFSQGARNKEHLFLTCFISAPQPPKPANVTALAVLTLFADGK